MSMRSCARGVGLAVGGALVLVTAVPTAATAAPPDKSPPIEVALTAPSEVEQGAQFDYVATISSGNSALDDVRLTDALPASVSYVQAFSEVGSCGISNDTVQCDLGSLRRRTANTVRITVKAQTSGTTVNAVQVQGTSGGGARTGEASVSTTVTPVPVTERQASWMAAADGAEPGTYCYNHPGTLGNRACETRERQYPWAFLRAGSQDSSGERLAGKTVTFTMNDGRHVCEATVQTDGRVSCSNAEWDRVLPEPLQPIGDTTYTASFAGDADYLPSSVSARTTNQTGPIATPLYVEYCEREFCE